MKRKSIAVGLFYLFAAGLWSCSNSSDDQEINNEKSLQKSLFEQTIGLEQAIGTISRTPGFEILTNKGNTKSTSEDDRFSASITLDDLKGIYDYQINSEDTSTTVAQQNRYFKKTGESDMFIIRLPKERATNHSDLFSQTDQDTTWANDFVITTSDFLYQYSGGINFNYLLDTRIDVEDQFAGTLKIKWNLNSLTHMDYSCTYGFDKDYAVGMNFQKGDTISFEYQLTKQEEPLYREKYTLLPPGDSTTREREYSLFIGDVEIVRSSLSDTFQVYKGGVLQENATVEIITQSNEQDDNIAFCRKGRDMQITFDDGTSVLLSYLMGDSLETLNTLFESLGDVYFATHLVNRMAFEIYYLNK